MAFIIRKKSKRYGEERNLYYLVKNYRDGSKIKREAIMSIGRYPSLSEALLCLLIEEKQVLVDFSKLKKRIDLIKKGDISAFFPFLECHKQYPRGIEILLRMENKLDAIRRRKTKLKRMLKLYPNCCSKSFTIKN